MINSKMIFRILGFLLLIETAMLLCCGAVSLFYKENDLQSFLISSAVTACIGFLLLAIGKDAVKSLNRRDGYVIVSAAWGYLFPFRNVTLLYRRIYSQCCGCIFLKRCPDLAVQVPLF